MHRITLSIVFSLTFFSLFAQSNSTTLNTSRHDETVLTFHLNSYNLKTVTTTVGEEQIIIADNLSAIMEKAAPDLPKFTESILIPDTDLMQVKVIYSEFTEIQNIEIAPSKGNFTRDIDPATVPYEYGRNYTEDRFYPGNLTHLDAPYIMRDFRGQSLHVYPFQYNPVTKTLKVYSEIQVKVFTDGEIGENQFERINDLEAISKEYANIYKKHFINYTDASRYTPVEETGNMLIICYDDWTEYMEEFVHWKNTIGRPTEMISVTDAGGTAAAIKTYVTDYYNTNGLTYLLLVGDSDQVPTNSGGDLGGHSDNAYAYISGDDHYLEFFVGRFSAEDPIHVMTQALRSIEYEKGDELSDGWLNKAMSVGSQEGDGSGDDGEADWVHLRNIQADLVTFTYEEPFFEHFDGSQGAPDATGNPSPAEVAASLNTGLGFVNYTGHGSDTSWASSGFSIADVNGLVNKNKLPFIYDVACVNGNFVGQDCFGEAWLRAENGVEPTGAVAIAASTINQSWAPPMIAQDEMTDILVSLDSKQKRTYGGIFVNGMFQMNDESSDFAMTDTWTCFGDPSLYVRTDNTSEMVISHSDVVIVGETSFVVTCDTDSGLATLSDNGVIVGSAVVNAGSAAIPIAGVTPGTVLTLAVIGFNKVTYLTTVSVIAPDGSYLMVESYENTIDYGQTNDLDMIIKNVGIDNATNVNVSVATTDVNASFENLTYAYGSIAADASSTASIGAFSLTLTDNVPDQYSVAFTVAISDDSDTWNETKFVTVNAPALSVGTLLTIDDATGNDDGILDPGETVNIHIQTSNLGHAAIVNVIGTIVSANSELTLNSVTTSPIDLDIDEMQEFIFNITADPTTTDGTSTTINYTVTGGTSNQYTASENFEIVIGFVPDYCDASADDATDEFIQRVQFNSIDNSSTLAAGYTDYTSIVTDITQGESHPITITNGHHYSSDQMGCWIDWNYDGDFDDADETITIAYTNPDGTGTVTVPANARLGTTRMRLRVMYTGDLSPCGNASYGEVEDYTVNILSSSLETRDYHISNISLYPNPNNGTFTLDLSKLNSTETVLVSIFNTQGQLVYNTKTNTSKLTVNLSEATGIFFLRVTIENQVLTKKLILN